MKRSFIHNTLFRVVAPLIYGVLIYLLILLINNNVTELNDLFNSEELYVAIALSYLSIESCRLIIVILNRYAPEHSRIRIIVQIVGTTAFSVSLIAAGLHLYFKYAIGFRISPTQLLIFMILFGITALLYNLLYFSSHYLQKENSLKLNAEKQQRQVLEMEMLEFRNDINPDLLYESLESLIALMYRDVEQAEEYIDCLASTYRYALSNRQQELVPVRDEVAAAANVVNLLNEKYHGLLRLQVEIGQVELTQLLIPGSLPLIVESIVRNTIINRFEPFLIRCYIEDNYLTVQTPLNDRLITHEQSENAFARLQRSYSLYSELPLIKVKAYQENYIKLPIVSLVGEMA